LTTERCRLSLSSVALSLFLLFGALSSVVTLVALAIFECDTTGKAIALSNN